MSRGLDQDEAAQVLASTMLFSELDQLSLSRLAARTTQRSYARGQFLFYQGDPGDRLFVIAEGMVKILLTSEQGDEVVLATLGRHESLGELAVLDGAPRSAAVLAVEPSTALMLSRPTLLGLMAQHPEVLDAILRSLGTLVRRQTEQTGDFVFLDLGGRVAKLLLRLSAAHGTGDGSNVLDLHLSQSELASMVGASRPAVNRALQLLASRGWISIDGQVIVLRDLDSLRHRAGV